MVTACKKNNLTLKKKKDRERHRDWSSFPAQIHYSNMTFLLPLPLQKWYLHEFCQTGSLVGTFSKKKKEGGGGELVEVPQTILVLALFLFSIIEMNWILRAEKECGVGGSCGVRIVSFCVSSPFLETWETDIKEQVHCGWVRVCERETERVPGCLHSLSCSLRGALSMSGSTYWSNSEPEWLSWLQGQSRKAAHKKRTGHRFYCFCALMSFFSAAGANPDHAVDLAYSTSYVTCPFCPTSSYLPPSVLEPVDGSVRLKKKNRKKRCCSKDWAARGG